MLYRIKMNLTFEKYKVYGEFYQTQITKYTKKSKRLEKSFLVDGCIALLFAWLLKNMILVTQLSHLQSRRKCLIFQAK